MLTFSYQGCVDVSRARLLLWCTEDERVPETTNEQIQMFFGLLSRKDIDISISLCEDLACLSLLLGMLLAEQH